MKYADKLKDPRWDAVRREVLARDRNTCQTCGCVDEIMHVHHIEYFKGFEPWEYHTAYLITLCEMCHGIVSDKDKSFHEKVGALSLQLLISSNTKNYSLDIRYCLKTISNIVVGASCQGG